MHDAICYEVIPKKFFGGDSTMDKQLLTLWIGVLFYNSSNSNKFNHYFKFAYMIINNTFIYSIFLSNMFESSYEIFQTNILFFSNWDLNRTIRVFVFSSKNGCLLQMIFDGAVKYK